jgi:hypothetical protein
MHTAGLQEAVVSVFDLDRIAGPRPIAMITTFTPWPYDDVSLRCP